MDNMSNHEVYILGWVTGRIEGVTGLRCNLANPDICPFSTMGYMLSKAHITHKVTRELDDEIRTALEDFDAEHGPDGTEKPLPMNRRIYWNFGYQAGSTGKPYNPDWGGKTTWTTKL